MRGIAPNRIPAEIFAPIIRRYLEKQPDIRPDKHDKVLMAPLCALSVRAELAEDGLSRLLFGHKKSISFDHADRVLCAMGEEHLWYEWPLLVFYQAIDFSALNSLGSIDEERACAHPECSNTFQPRVRAPHQKFCGEHQQHSKYRKVAA